MKILCTIGSLSVTLYGLFTALALLCFWGVGCLYLVKQRKDGDTLRFVLLTGGLGWLMARVLFVLCDMSYYVDELNGYWAPALCFWDGGYSMIGAIVGAVLGAHLCGRDRNIALGAVGLAMPLGVAVLRLAEFICDTEASGDIGEGSWMEGGAFDSLLQKLGLVMQADGDLCYPACLAEFICAALLFAGLLIWLRRGKPGAGDMLTVSLMLYGTVMVVLEQLRNDGHLIFHFVHIQQVLALLLVLQAPVRWTLRLKKQGKPLKRVWLLWAVMAVCMGVAVLACFGVDRWDNKALAWSLLTFPAAALPCLSLFIRREAVGA